ncbi:MAG: hypothetical protein ACODAF_03050 [Actinomycetota bacterium]
MSVLPLPALISALSARDLTDPERGPHALQLLIDAAVETLTHLWGCPARIVRARPVATVGDNFDRLGYAADALALESRYTHYAGDTCLVCSRTSDGVPPALRRLAGEAEPPEQVLLALPGICLRRGPVDRLHTGTPHQLDLWLIRHGGRPLDLDDLSRTVGRLMSALLPGRHWRWTAAAHPYTVNSRHVDVIDGGDAVEIAECGLAAPHVLAAAGLDPVRWNGLALGIGLDRALMVRKGIPDIRLLRSEEPQVAEQMLDLSPYRPAGADARPPLIT